MIGCSTQNGGIDGYGCISTSSTITFRIYIYFAQNCVFNLNAKEKSDKKTIKCTVKVYLLDYKNHVSLKKTEQ